MQQYFSLSSGIVPIIFCAQQTLKAKLPVKIRLEIVVTIKRAIVNTKKCNYKQFKFCLFNKAKCSKSKKYGTVPSI